LLLASCDDASFARQVFAAVEGLGQVKYARAWKGSVPADVNTDAVMLCRTAIAELTAVSPPIPPNESSEGPPGVKFGGQWHPTPMPMEARQGLYCMELWGMELQSLALRALDEPGSFWSVVPSGEMDVDSQWSLYSPRFGIVAWLKEGSAG
jgi:hypothetical protein